MKMKKILKFTAKPHILFIIVAIIGGVCFIKLTPPLWGLDEQAHFARVLHILRGDFVSTQDKNDSKNFIPDNLFELYQYRTNDILDVVKSDSVLNRHDVTNINTYSIITSNQFVKSEHFFPVIANYSPAAYPGPIVGLFVAQLFHLNIDHTLFLTRLAGLFSYIAVSAVAIWLVRKYKAKWLFFAIALIPTAIFQASVITADTILVASVLLFFALLYRVLQDKVASKSILMALGILAVMIPLMKLNYFILILSLIIIPFSKFKTKKYAALYKFIIITIGIAVVVAWSLITHVTASPQISQRADGLSISPLGQITNVLNNPISFAFAIIRSLITFGDMYYQGMLFTVSGNTLITPLVLTLVLSIVLIIFGLIAKDELSKIKKPLVWMCIASLVMSLTIFAALYAGFTPVGYPIVDGVQGRYFLPVLLPLVMSIAVFVPIDLKKISKRSLSILITVPVLALAISLLYVKMALY